MNVDSKPVLIFSTLGVGTISALIGIFFSPWVGVISALFFAVGGLILKNISLHNELKGSLDKNMTQLRSELTNQIQMVASELITVKGEIATRPGCLSWRST